VAGTEATHAAIADAARALGKPAPKAPPLSIELPDQTVSSYAVRLIATDVEFLPEVELPEGASEVSRVERAIKTLAPKRKK
jgi:hypothetical protein